MVVIALYHRFVGGISNAIYLKKPRFGKNILLFRLVDTNVEGLNRKLKDFEIVKVISSKPESEVEKSDLSLASLIR